MVKFYAHVVILMVYHCRFLPKLHLVDLWEMRRNTSVLFRKLLRGGVKS